MSAPEILNLDELPTAAAERTLVLGGVKHEMRPMSVGAFIDQRRAAKAADLADDAAGAESLVTLINTLFPTLSVEELKKLTMAKLRAILEFISKRADELVTAAGGPGAEAKN